MSTFAELKTEVVEELGDINVTDDATKLARWLNRGVRDFLRKTRCYQDQITVTPGAVSEYTLAAAVLDVVDLAVQGQRRPVERQPVFEIRARLRGDSSAGASLSSFALAGNNLLLFYPALSATTVIDMLVVPAPTAMSSDSHDPSNATYGGVPEDYHDAVALYAEWRIASTNDDASSSQGARYKEWYEQRVTECRRELNRKGGHRLARASLRRGYQASDPSVTTVY